MTIPDPLRSAAQASKAWPYEEARKLLKRYPNGAPDKGHILFETGYISNAEDAAFLASREGQQKIARGVARAIEVHFARKLAMHGGAAGG